MDITEAQARALRLVRIVVLLYEHPEGLTAREIARHCGCHVRTIQRDLQALQDDLNVGLEVRSGHRYRIRRGAILRMLRLDLPQTVALYLAARVLHRHGEVRNPHVLNAMRRIAEALPEHLASELLASLGDEQPGRAETAIAFERLSTGWAMRRRLRIEYRSATSEDYQTYVIDPYLIEPAGYSQGLYVIAYCHDRAALRTFKFDRVRHVELLDEVFERPDTSSLWRQLRQAWGIVWTDDEPGQRIRVRFSPAAARRVRESVWHPSQRVRTVRDGGCELEMYVPSLTELLPWLRGWGPDAEVLEPAPLRERLASEAWQLAQRYGVAAQSEERSVSNPLS